MDGDGFNMEDHGEAPVEPHADIRESAATAWQIYVAYQEAGFTELQSFEVVKAIVSKNC